MHPPVDTDDLDFDLDRAAAALRRARRVVVLTGAGVSAESGIPTFRASDGLWEGHRIEDVATPQGFGRDPALVWQFYNARRDNLRNAAPNPGHRALVGMEERWRDGFALVTQNVDGLHRLAGNRNVFEVHGSLYRTRCTGCGRIEERGLEPLGELPHCPHCGALLRPDVVWFHEQLPQDTWAAALEAVHDCDCLLVVGTSAVVHPAASLIPLAKRRLTYRAPERRDRVIEVNLKRTAASDEADIGLYGPSGLVLPMLLERVNH